jgi:hypothetical protein
MHIVVSGNGDYYEKIMRLLEQGYSVCLIASASNMDSRHRRVE